MRRIQEIFKNQNNFINLCNTTGISGTTYVTEPPHKNEGFVQDSGSGCQCLQRLWRLKLLWSWTFYFVCYPWN